MATTIKLKNSVTTTNAPSSLVQGEVAINITDKKVWVGNAATTPIQLLGDGGSASFTSIAFGAGTVSSPSITFTGDTNTGIYSPAADTIAFTEGGVESMRIDSSGNVGIGTASPSCRLDLNRGSAGLLANFTDGVNTNFQIETASLLATIGPSAGSTGMAFKTGNTERMRITNQGYVGIGVTNPTSILEVTGGAGNEFRATRGTNNFVVSLSNNAGNEVYVGPQASSPLVFQTANAERMRITSGGNVGIGTSSPAVSVGTGLNISGSYAVERLTWTNTANTGFLEFCENSSQRAFIQYRGSTNANGERLELYVNNAFPILFFTNATERMRITSGGILLIGQSSSGSLGAAVGIQAYGTGYLYATANNDAPGGFARKGSDGDLVLFRRDTSTEGTISVSGSTVSYNGGHLSRWSQLPDGSKDETILKGTVMSNLDDMCVWEKDGVVANNEQLNKMKVSDVEGDINVAGVFVNWTVDSDYGVDDMNIAMTGDMIIRIAQGVVVQKGDLLMSAGDGTAKPQGDDIVRSKTVAKVTSNHVTCTYADGSYCVPCVLMAC